MSLMPLASDARAEMVSVVLDRITVLFAGDEIVIDGGVMSGVGSGVGIFVGESVGTTVGTINVGMGVGPKHDDPVESGLQAVFVVR